MIVTSGYCQDSLMRILNEKFPALELKQDLAFIRNKAQFKKYNHDGLLLAGKVNFNRLYDSIESVIDEKGAMSRLDFFYLTAPLVRMLKDDGSLYNLRGNYSYDNQGKKKVIFAEKSVIPLLLQIFNDTVYVTGDSTALYQSRLISINGIPAKKIVSEIFRLTSFTGDRYYRKYGYGYLPLYHYPELCFSLFGFHDKVEIEYMPPDTKTTIFKELQLTAIGDSLFKAIEEKPAERLRYRLFFRANDAVLRIIPMRNDVINVDEMNGLFKTLSESPPETLIIDLSYCYYSSDIFWLVMLNYLFEGELWLYGYHKEPVDLAKYSREKMKKSQMVKGKFSRIDRGNSYNGKIYLITGPYTASAAVRFADIMRYNHIATGFFGRETMIMNPSYDFPTLHYLPVTGLVLYLSYTFFDALDSNRNMSGFMPDVIIQPDNITEARENRSDQVVIEKVLEFIHKE